MLEADTFLAAVEQVYATALNPSLWPAALTAIARAFDDVGANLIYRREDGAAVTIVSPSLQKAHEDYDAGWWQQDIRWVRAAEYGYKAGGGPITERDMVTEQELATHPFFTDFQRRHGLQWIASIEISPDPRFTVALSVHRGPQKDPYSKQELDRLARLGSHVEQSLRLGVRLIQSEVATTGLGGALSQVNIGVFILNAERRVIFSNAYAQQIIGNHLRIEDGRFAFSGTQEQRRVENALTEAFAAEKEPTKVRPRPVMLNRGTGQSALALYAMPLGPQEQTFSSFISGGRIAVLCIDPANQPADPALLRDLLGLTLGEARVAAQIGCGLAPREAAMKLGISEETVRSVLKRVFSKTGVSRQAELVALITRLALS